MELIATLLENKLLAVAGVLGLALIGHWLVLSRDRLTAQRQAAAAVAAAFRGELDALFERGGNAGVVLDDTAFKKHQAAIRTNFQSLSCWRQARLWFAWQALAYRGGNQFYAQYFDGGSLDKRQKLLPLAKRRLQRVIAAVS
jgi:hypothetical protein